MIVASVAVVATGVAFDSMQMTEDGKVAYRCEIEVREMAGGIWSFIVYSPEGSTDEGEEWTLVAQGFGYPTEESANDAAIRLSRHFESEWEREIEFKHHDRTTKQFMHDLQFVAFSPELFQRLEQKLDEWEQQNSTDIARALGRSASSTNVNFLTNIDRTGIYGKELPKVLRKNAAERE